MSKETSAKIEALNSINKNLENITGRVTPEADDIDISNMLSKANLFYYDRKYEQAIDLFNKILKKEPKHLDALINKGWSLMELGYEEEAIKVADTILEYYPEELVRLDIKSTSLLNKGLTKQALEILEQILARNKHDPRANSLKGICLVNLRRYKEAIPALEIAINDYPDNFEYLERLALSYEMTGSLDKAKKSYEQIVKSISPSNVIDWNTKGNALYSLKKYEDALKAYDEGLNIDSWSALTWLNKANCLTSLNRYEDALKAYTEALKINPSYVEALTYMGFTFEDLGRYDDAIKAYDEALKIDPSYELALQNKKSLIKRIGERK